MVALTLAVGCGGSGEGAADVAAAVDAVVAADVAPAEVADAAPGPDAAPRVRMGFLPLHPQHTLSSRDCLPDDCTLTFEEEDDLPGWLAALGEESNLAVLHWDRPIPYLAFAAPLPDGEDRLAFYDARLDPDLRARIDAFAAHFATKDRGYLAVSLLGGDRTGYQPLALADGRTVDIASACPDFAPGATVTVRTDPDDPATETTFAPGAAYLAFVQYLVARLAPDDVALLVEANHLRALCPARFDGLVALYRTLYDAVRAEVGPDVRLFATLAWQPLLAYDQAACFRMAVRPCGQPVVPSYAVPDPAACYPLDRTALDALDEGGRLDVLALSFYPDALLLAPPAGEPPTLAYYATDWDGVAGCTMQAPYGPFVDPLAPIEALGWTKPVAIAEWSARSCRTLARVGSTSGPVWVGPGGTPASQHFWLEHVLAAAAEGRFAFVVWSFLADYAPLPAWVVEDGVLGAFPFSLVNTWACSGLYDADGVAKPALGIWRRYRLEAAQPVRAKVRVVPRGEDGVHRGEQTLPVRR